MPRKFLREFRDGDTVEEVFLLADRQLRANRNANLYLLASLRDRTGVMSGLMWNVSEDFLSHVNAGDYVRVKGKVQVYQGSLQMIISQISQEPSEGLDADDFRPPAARNVETLLSRLRELLLAIECPSLRMLMECFLVDEELMHNLSRAPAGVKTHHAYHGGLLEHIVNILETANRIADLYPEVDMDLLSAGIFLHDLGKIREMDADPSFVYTDEGQLLGHLVIGIEMLTARVLEVERMTGEPFPQETVLRLKHMIASHHGTYEFGSPRLPMTPEAVALHHLDNLDAKIHEFSRSIQDDPNPDSHWTPYSNRLARKLFKGAARPAEPGDQSTNGEAG